MSKRLQVLLPNDEYKSLLIAAKKRNSSISSLVRESLNRTVLSSGGKKTAEEKLTSLMRYAQLDGYACDIEQMLQEIEDGRNEGQ